MYQRDNSSTYCDVEHTLLHKLDENHASIKSATSSKMFYSLPKRGVALFPFQQRLKLLFQVSRFENVSWKYCTFCFFFRCSLFSDELTSVLTESDVWTTTSWWADPWRAHHVDREVACAKQRWPNAARRRTAPSSCPRTCGPFSETSTNVVHRKSTARVPASRTRRRCRQTERRRMR